MVDEKVSEFLSEAGKKSWESKTEKEKKIQVKKAGVISWYKKSKRQKKAQIDKMQAGRKQKIAQEYDNSIQINSSYLGKSRVSETSTP